MYFTAAILHIAFANTFCVSENARFGLKKNSSEKGIRIFWHNLESTVFICEPIVV